MAYRVRTLLYTFSFDMDLKHYIKKLILDFSIVLIMFLLLGETAFRLPWSSKLVNYDYDPVLGFKLSANQSNSMGLANFSILSPPIGINKDGFRYHDDNYQKHKIIALGSSEVLGPGVKDNETWTYYLEKKLRKNYRKDISVINAGHGGYGPFHSSVRLKRIIKSVEGIDIAIVRVSISDRNFNKPEDSSLKQLKRNNKRNNKIKKLSKFLPFLANKLQSQIFHIKLRIKGNGRIEDLYDYEKADAAVKMWENNKPYFMEIIRTCSENNINAIFYIDNAYDTPSGNKLYELFYDFINNENLPAHIINLNSSYFDISGETVRERRSKFKQKYTLVNDPHANMAQHLIIAQVLFDYLTKSTDAEILK